MVGGLRFETALTADVLGETKRLCHSALVSRFALAVIFNMVGRRFKR
jgi:hypothetical protein